MQKTTTKKKERMKIIFLYSLNKGKIESGQLAFNFLFPKMYPKKPRGM
jgi:hypothetical protein